MGYAAGSVWKKILDRRIRFIEEVNAIIGDIHHKLTGGGKESAVSYESSMREHVDGGSALKKNRERDLRMKSTSVGPHRDDICFTGRRFGYQQIRIAGAAENSCAVAEII